MQWTHYTVSYVGWNQSVPLEPTEVGGDKETSIFVLYCTFIFS